MMQKTTKGSESAGRQATNTTWEGRTDRLAGRQAGGRQACMQQQQKQSRRRERGRGASASKRMLLQAAAKRGGSNPVPTANGAQLTCP